MDEKQIAALLRALHDIKAEVRDLRNDLRRREMKVREGAQRARVGR